MASTPPPAFPDSEHARRAQLLSRFVDLRPGEGRIVLGASTVLAGIVAAHVLLETTRDALFLTKLEPQALPFVYIAMAVLGFQTARADRFISRLFGRKNALVLGLMGAATGTMLFYAEGMGQVRAFALYLWSGVITTLLTVQFWLTVGQRFTPAQGRRLFGLLAAGGVLGGVLGASAGALLAERFPIQSLLLVAGGLHLVTALLVTAAPPATEVVSPRPRVRMTEGIGEVRHSSYLLRVGLLIQVSVATVLLVDYVFKGVMTARLPASELGVSLARYYAVMNAVALLVQLFMTMSILQRMGTILALTVLPLAILGSGAVGLAFGAPLLFVLLAKGADGALRFSLHRVSTELLFLPLDGEERSRIKPLLDSVLSRATQAFVAIIILLGTRFFEASFLAFAYLALGLAVVWVALAWSLRAPYLERFRTMLGAPAKRPGFSFQDLNLDSVAVLVEALSSPDENRVLTAMKLFQEGNRRQLVPALVLYHPSPRVLVGALEVLPAKGRTDWIPLAERLLGHADAQVRLAAISALGQSGHLAQVDPASFGDHPSLVAAAAFFLADGTAEPSQHPALKDLLSARGEPTGQIALLEAIARSRSDGWTEAIVKLEALERPELNRVLPKAMAKTGDLRFVYRLVRRLSQRDGRDEVRTALVTFGDPALDALEVALYDRHTPPALRLHIPRAISRFASQRAGEILLVAMERNLAGALRYKALRGLGRLVALGAYTPTSDRILPLIQLNLSEQMRFASAHQLLILHTSPASTSLSGLLFFGLLEDKMRQALERVLRLFQILHPREDFRRVYYGLVSGDAQSRVAASEILDVTSVGYGDEIRDLLRQLGDHFSPTRIRDKAPDSLHTSALLNELLNDSDPLVAALSDAFSRELEIAELEPLIERAMQQNRWLIENAEDRAR